MWPIALRELYRAVRPDAVPVGGALAPTLEATLLRRACAWRGAPPHADSVLFAVDREIHDEVPAALAVGATCVVAKGWPGIGACSRAERERLFVADSPLAAFRRFASFFRERLPSVVIAVGGSNGKTTTKDMIVGLLAHRGAKITATTGTNNGWVGTPITLCRLDHTEPAPEAVVLEIGIDERGAMREHVAIVRPDIAVLTALGAEHLRGLGSHEQAICEELELFAAKRRVWLADDPALAARLDAVRTDDIVVHDVARDVKCPCRRLSYSWSPRGAAEGTLRVFWQDRTCDVRVPMPGLHNGRNAALALGVSLLLGRTPEEVAPALDSFVGPAQRCTVRRMPSGCIVVDDSYNASPASVEAALEVVSSFDPERVRLLVLGDMLDLGDASEELHRALAPRLADLESAHVRLFGDRMSEIAALIPRAASIGRASDPADPAALLDLDEGLLDDAVVLVKGSRGMHLERVTARLEELCADHRPRGSVAVGVAGVDADAIARALRRRLPAGRAVVRALSLADLAGGRPARARFDVGVVSAHVRRGSGDLELELATLAQLLVHLPSGGVAVVAGDGDVTELLASVVPRHARTCRPRREEIVDLVVEMLDTLACGSV